MSQGTVSSPSGLPAIRIPRFVGIVFGIAAGVACVVAAVMFKKVIFGIWGGVFLLGGLVAVLGGAKVTPDGSISDRRVGAKYEAIPEPHIYIIMGLVAIGIVCTFIFPPWR
jgi:hypothetical protein